ncbi:helix-turn-helix domain-containing protein [Moraxella boevrei]|uniref:helix-turn-helix domain-containing protein n=1 Tax=Faucicola boevrei TaxID=346665 RepID=UPI003734FD05
MIHQALKNIRQFHNIKQSDLSVKLGISNSYLSEIEGGKKSPSLELLSKYSEIFDIPVSSLLFFSESLEGDDKSLASKFQKKSSKLIIRLLEWSNTIEQQKSP